MRKPVYFNSHELIDGDIYKGYPLQEDKGPFVKRDLDKIIRVMNASLKDYPRTFAFRVDLRMPRLLSSFTESRLIERFISSFKEKVRHARIRARRDGYAHDTCVRYLWAREIGDHSGRPHFHLIIFVNRDAYNCLGRYRLGNSNLYSRMVEAWASALRIEPEDAVGLVHIPRAALYSVSANNPDSQNELFYRASYMAKAATKVRGSKHCFGGSRG